MTNAADLVGDLEFCHDLVDVNTGDDVDNGLSTDVVALNVQQLQSLVLVQRRRQRLLSQSTTLIIISVLSADDRENLFLFQRISVAIQRFNAVLLHDGFPSEDHPD